MIGLKRRVPGIMKSGWVIAVLYGFILFVALRRCSKGILTCIDFLTGELAWRNRSVGTGSVVYADGHFIMRGDGGTVALVEATPEQYREKGRFDQPDRSDRPARTYPVVTGGRLYRDHPAQPIGSRQIGAGPG